MEPKRLCPRTECASLYIEYPDFLVTSISSMHTRYICLLLNTPRNAENDEKPCVLDFLLRKNELIQIRKKGFLRTYIPKKLYG